MVQAFKREQKEAEQARKRAAAEERQVNRTLAKQAKNLAASQKKLDDIKCKSAAAAAAVVGGRKSVKKAAPNAPQKAARKAPNPRKKIAIRTTRSITTAPPKKRPAPALPAAPIDVAAAAPTARSRSGRMVTRPTRFED